MIFTKEDKALRFLYLIIDYGLRRVMREFPGKRRNTFGLDNLITKLLNLPGGMIPDSISVRKRYDSLRALRCHWPGDATPAVIVDCVYLTAAVIASRRTSI